MLKSSHMSEKPNKNPLSEREEEILKFWRENKIFEKTLNKPSPKGNFVFYEGPPTANGRPGIHHLESRAFKDLIPRFKTMQGYYVRRKGGWDTHGLPVEIQVEKELDLKSKREIEEYGIAKFNEKCKESVWKYINEWRDFTERIGYWVDLKNPYITYKPYYIESVWNIIKNVDNKKLLYKDYKVLPWCPRCQTALSSHELAQGYQDVKDLSVYVKFKVKNPEKIGLSGDIFLLAWTTTPWTLPGNVALAVNPKINYSLVELDGQQYILAEDLVERIFKSRTNLKSEILNLKFKGSDLVGLEYEPLYPFLSEKLKAESSQLKALENAFKVYPADFVTTEDGTGIVHTAVMYGQDDFELGTKVNLPKYHLVNEDGTFKDEAGFLAGKFVKPARSDDPGRSGGDEATDIEIIKDLAHRGLLFHKEKYSHSYPHCWRCKTPLIYFARDSWYIKMSQVKDKLIKENQKINWEPAYIKEGRFGEWLKDVKDWAISRERYWGTPLPVWVCGQTQTAPSRVEGRNSKSETNSKFKTISSKQGGCGNREVIGSFEELFLKDKNKTLTRLILLRHGESEKNTPEEILDSSENGYPLTKLGEKQAKNVAGVLSKLDITAVYSSPVRRARQTAEIISEKIKKEVVLENKLWEIRHGEWEGKKVTDPSIKEFRLIYNKLSDEDYYKTSRGQSGESWKEVEERVVSFLKEVIKKHKGETVVIISHEGPLMYLLRYLKKLSLEEITNLWDERRTYHRGLLGSYAEPTFVFVDSETGREIDPHRPQIDEFKLPCECGGEMTRVKEVMDVWFDSGAMPFAQDHYPFKNMELVEQNFPADFISEAIDQTRGWFYTLHAIGVFMGKGQAYKNVICLGHLLDKEGKKMSKSLGNIVVPEEVIKKYGADALRFWMYSVNQPGDSKNFDEGTVDEVVKKVINPLVNVLAFYQMSADESFEIKRGTPESRHILDLWILTLLSNLEENVTKNLESYKVLESARSIREFIADLSQWYLRRSRDRLKEGSSEALATLGFVLFEITKILAPFMPFISESIYQELKIENKKESVHLEEWFRLDSRFPEYQSKAWYGAGKIPRIPNRSLVRDKQDSRIIEEMEEIRKIVSLALEQRAKAGIKVRQPLALLKIQNPKSEIQNNIQLLNLIKDEVNVKEVVFSQKAGPVSGGDGSIVGEVELDLNITPELELEGQRRDFVRQIQDFRKNSGLESFQEINLKIKTDQAGEEFIKGFEEELFKVSKVHFSFKDDVMGETFKVGKFEFIVSR